MSDGALLLKYRDLVYELLTDSRGYDRRAIHEAMQDHYETIVANYASGEPARNCASYIESKLD